MDQYKSPIYESLVDKVSRLISLWKEKTKNFEKIYQEGLKIIKERNKLLKRKKDLGLDDFEYSSLLWLEKKIGKKKNLDKDIKELSSNVKKQIFHNWYFQTVARKKVEKEIRKFLIKNKRKYGIDLNQVDELSYGIFKNLEKYRKS